MNRRSINLARVGSLAAAPLVAIVASAQDATREKCYGIAFESQNDCTAGPKLLSAGTSSLVYQGGS